MIPVLTILLIISVLILTMMQTVLVLRYYWFHRDAPQQDESSGATELPKAAIILCLRGHEESTPDCVAELIGQDYCDYRLHIAFDSQDDPAVHQVEEFFENREYTAQLHFFEPQQSCSYKCSGIVHVLNQLEDDVEFVAFCDGDAIVDVSWLRDLIQPMMQNEKIGATTGNRWFSPFQRSVGGMVRKLWNAAAVVQMQAYDIAWGGSLAVRKSAIDSCGLMELWSTTFCEDTVLTGALEAKGLQIHRVPNLIIENRETTSILNCFHWIARQLLTVRLHHDGWPLVMMHGFVGGLASIVAPFASALLLYNGYFNEGRSLLIVWFVYQIVNFVLLTVVERCNQNAIAQRHSSELDVTMRQPSGNTIGMIGVQLLYPLAVMKATLMRSVRWRGVDYSVSGNSVSVKQSRRSN